MSLVTIAVFGLPSEDEPTETSTPGDIPVEEEGTSLCYFIPLFCW